MTTAQRSAPTIDASPTSLRRDLIIAGLILPAGFAVLWLRITPAVRHAVYAEDGSEFLGQWLTGGRWGAWFHPMGGYQHLLPRILASVVSWTLPIQQWGVGVTGAACVAVATVAALTYLFSRDICAFVGARLGLAAIPLLIPIGSLEALGNVSNLHWFLLYLLFWVLLYRPTSTVALWFCTALMLVIALSEVQSAFLAPLALWRFVSERRLRIPILGYGLGVAVQALTALTTERGRTPGYPSVASTADGYLLNVVTGTVTSDRKWVSDLLLDHGWWILSLFSVPFVLALIIAVMWGTRPVVTTSLLLVAFSILVWTAAFVSNNNSGMRYDSYDAVQLKIIGIVRWGTTAGMWLAAVVPLAAAAIVQRWGSRWAGWLVVVALMATMTIGFLNGDQRQNTGQTWDDGVTAARAECGRSSDPAAVVQIQQFDVFRFDVPCSALTD